ISLKFGIGLATPARVKYRSRFVLVFVAILSLAGTSSSTANAATCSVWRLSNSKTPFYLVGTLHALSGSDYPLPLPYRDALQNSQRFFFEFDFNRSKEFSQKFQTAGKYPKGQDIRRHVHPQ